MYNDGATPNTWSQVANEHCYPKLMAQWTSLDQPLPTYHIFQQCRTNDGDTDRWVCQELIIHILLLLLFSGVESTDETGLNEETIEDDVDVEHVTTPPSLPYNERKVASVMYECYQHMNLVRLPLENTDKLLEK